MESSRRSGRTGRIVLLGAIAVGLAFAGGLALGRSDGDGGAAKPAAAALLGHHPTPRGVRLLRVDPGTLHRAAPAAQVTVSASEVAVTAPRAAPPAPAPAPAPAPQSLQTPAPSSPAEGESFDSSDQNSFDSDG